jgi:SAM-dependent methyltransferase
MTRLDLGCGKNPKEGFAGVDVRDFGQEIVCDLRGGWKFEDDSVDEVHCSHFVEHLTGPERIHFVNELYRVLKPGAKATIIAPHWSSCRAYGDLTHQWPPVSEFWFYYLLKGWRDANAPHNDDYTCDFDATWGYSLHGEILKRNPEFQLFAVQWYKEAAQDICATLVKRSHAPPSP